MKRLFMTLAAVMCCAMISTVFIACSDDDDNDSADKTKAVAAIMNCKISSPPSTLPSNTTMPMARCRARR